MYFGGLWGGQLEKWQTELSILRQDLRNLMNCPRSYSSYYGDDMLTFADTQEIKVLDEKHPLLAGDEDRRFFDCMGA